MILLLIQAWSLICTIAGSLFWVLIYIPNILLSNILPRRTKPHPGCLFYEGNVVHHRRKPVDHYFTYSLRLALIDLDNAPSWFHKQSKDHWSSVECRRRAGTEGKVKLLTNPTSCNYTQNPISVYYCFSSSGSLEKCIAEVTNTPWGARVNFLFDPVEDEVCKALHVSPLMDMESKWKLKSQLSDNSVTLSVSCKHPEMGNFFHVIMHLKRSNRGHYTNDNGGFSTLWRFGFLPHRVAFWIYWQAICLITKGVPIYGYPDTQKVKTKVECDSQNLKFTSDEHCIWRDPKSFPWNAQA